MRKEGKIMVILSEKFRFIRDDVFLCPEVDTETGRQQVIIQKVDSKTGKVEFEDFIYCIHVCITSITPDEHERYYSDPDFHEKIEEISLNIRSTETLKEINLNPKEKFVALKSWAEGIADAGIDAFTLQTDIDLSAGINFPLTGRLMQFMIKVEPEFLHEFISRTEKNCSVDGVIHKTSFSANFLPLLETIAVDGFFEIEIPSKDAIISTILDSDPSPLIFKGHLELLILRMMVEPGFLNRFLVKLRKSQTAQEYSAFLKHYTEQIIDKFKPDNSTDIEFLKLNKYEREILITGMKESSKSICREISKSLFETSSILSFLFYHDYENFDNDNNNYFKNDNFKILTELIKSAPIEVIPSQKIVEKLIDEFSKEFFPISKILSNPRIKEPIVALLSKNPPISIYKKEPYLIFFYIVYIDDTFTLEDFYNLSANQIHNLLFSVSSSRFKSVKDFHF